MRSQLDAIAETCPACGCQVNDPFAGRTPVHDVLGCVAASWLGTPWCANSAVKGKRGGVSCHNLPRAILVEAGWLPESFPVVEGDPNSARHGGSVIERWLDGRSEFTRFPISELRSPGGLRPGDLLGLRIRRCVDHLGLYLGEGRFIHTLQHKHTAIDRITDPTWGSRLLAVWRPVSQIGNRKSEIGNG